MELEEEKQKHEVDFRELCNDLQQVNSKNEECINGLREEIKDLKRSLGLRLLHMESLKETIRRGNIAYDAMVARVENIDRTTEQQRTVQSLRTNKAVCRAFGWSLENVDPHLLRAACGFWESTTMDSEEYAEDNERVSLKMREDIWYKLTCLGFKGKVLKKMEQGWKKLHKFDVVELARRSDVDSRFNSRSLGAIAHCETGRRKFERGLLCSASTLRRTQKQVLDLAASLGFSTFPIQDKGNVWCWGDFKGDFETGVNRYVYEIYVKARSPLVTKDRPWVVPLTGDLRSETIRPKTAMPTGNGKDK
jgi:hypothetical protein